MVTRFLGTLIIGYIMCLFSCHENKRESLNGLFQLPDTLIEIPSYHFEPLLSMIEEAEIIATTEASHYRSEPLDFGNELIKFLVTEKAIDVIALESGILESKVLNDYVFGSSQSIDSALFNGFSWTFDKLPQNKNLLKWLKNHNADTTNDHKVKIYGFDVSGSPGNPYANRKMNTSLIYSLDFLKKVDKTNWQHYSETLSPYLNYIHVNLVDSSDSKSQYFNLSYSERNNITAIINEIIELYEINEISFAKKTSSEAFDWAYQAALGSRQVDNWLRTIPLGYTVPSQFKELVDSGLLWQLHQKRSRSMVDNAEWIMKREKNAKVLLFGNIYHLSKHPTTLIANDSIVKVSQHALGQYLSHRYGEKYRVIGNFYSQKKTGKVITQIDSDAVENIFNIDSINNYYRSIINAEPMFKKKLNRQWKYQVELPFATGYTNPMKAFDIVLFYENPNTD